MKSSHLSTTFIIRTHTNLIVPPLIKFRLTFKLFMFPVPLSDIPIFPYTKYIGTMSRTVTGKICQKWNSKSQNYQLTRNGDFPGETIENAENYCRDPWNSGFLWCYTTDVHTLWEPCISTYYKVFYCTLCVCFLICLLFVCVL